MITMTYVDMSEQGGWEVRSATPVLECSGFTTAACDERWWMSLLSLLPPGNNPYLPGRVRLCLLSLFPFPSLSSLILRLDGKYVIGGKR